MNVDVFLKQNIDKKEIYTKLIDTVNRVDRTWQEEFTDFLTPDEQYFLKLFCKDKDIVLNFYGGKSNFERAVALISKVELQIDYPVDILKISGNFKFEKINHRDYLGALLSLGIKREKIGDINVFNDGAEVYIHKDLSDYVVFNLNKIKHTGVQISKIDLNSSREREQKLDERNINVASERIDVVVAEVYNLSRSEATKLIKQGNVKVNYIVCDEQSKKLSENDIVSVKGFGRFVYCGFIRNTKSNRLVVLIKKYI